MRVVLPVGKQRTIHEVPIHEERSLQGCHSPTRHLQHRVAPDMSFGSLHITQGDVHAADESYKAVDNDDLSVVAVVHLTRERRETHGHERSHLDPLFTHPLEEMMTHVPATHVIVDHPDLHPLSRLRDKGI